MFNFLPFLGPIFYFLKLSNLVTSSASKTVESLTFGEDIFGMVQIGFGFQVAVTNGLIV